MRTKRTVERRRQSPRVRAGTHVDARAVPAGVPRCVTCGAPLSRLPRYLGSTLGATHGFQCQRCFYENATAPAEPSFIASEQTRMVSELVYGVPEPAPPAPAPSED